MQPYPDNFQCIGPACEDTCCHGWQITVDQPALVRILNSPLRQTAQTGIQLRPAATNPTQFAQMKLQPSGACPFLAPDKLCAIHSTLGQDALPLGCQIYPRVLNRIDGQLEKSLSLSCPEAARLVLLTPSLFGTAADSYRAFRQAIATAPKNATLSQLFWPLRHLHLAIVLDRSQPIRQRVARLGQLAHRLASARRPAQLLKAFRYSAPLPREQPSDLAQILSTLDSLLTHPPNNPRFSQTVTQFLAGIGFSPIATIDSLESRFCEAERDHLQPVLSQNPHLLENYLANAIMRGLYPFGTQAAHQAGSVIEAEFRKLSLNFSLLYGLLTGVSGFFGSHLNEAHIVQAVQSYSRATEHHPERLSAAMAADAAAPQQTAAVSA